MMNFIVLYRTKYLTELEEPFGFKCRADDIEHAEEQLINAEPDADIVWVVEANNYQEALDDYCNRND
jgi:hypothetical protein